MVEGEKAPFIDVREERDKLAQQIHDIRRERDEKRDAASHFKNKALGRSNRLNEEANDLNTEARDAASRGKEAIHNALENYASELRGMNGIGTDHTLIQWFYKYFRRNSEAHPVATDTFLDKSKDEYNAAWLARELVQNFVDHNAEHPGTLDGVTVDRNELEDGQTIQYVITGDWPYEDPTGIISPHSEKPTDINTAGGNGIGLKQAAIRLLRDFEVKRFEIQGENWVASYELAKADEVNRELEQTYARLGQPVSRTMRHDWLVARLNQAERSGSVSYLIETDNPEMIAALDQLQDLGVSENNRFLQNPDFVSEHGAIKWLPPEEDGTVPRGRLFINGQVMNFGSKGETAANYWVGPEYMSVRLDNIRYRMSIDRPPLLPLELKLSMGELISSMTLEQIVQQLKRSEPIWSNFKGKELPAIEVLVSSLSFRMGYDKSRFGQYFPDGKYLARDMEISPAQEESLQSQGFAICPSCFETIGMEKASGKLSSLEVAAAQAPNSHQAFSDAEKAAEESGVPVTYEDLGFLKPEGFLTYLVEHMSSAGAKPEVVFDQKKPTLVRMGLNVAIPKGLLSRSLSSPKTKEQKALNLARGAAFYGLQHGIFKSIYLAQGEYVTTFATNYDTALEEDSLCTRSIKASSPGVFLEFELTEEYAGLLSALTAGGNEATKQKTMDGGKGAASTEPESSGRVVRVVGKDVALDLSEREMKALEQAIPGIRAAVEKLEQATGEPLPQDASSKKTLLQKYVDWRNSGRAGEAAQENAGYIGARTLTEILDADNQADIAVVEPSIQGGDKEKQALSEVMTLRDRLKRAVERLCPEEEIDDFEIVLQPRERQLAQLGLLRMYSILTTGAPIENSLFLYNGTGSKGLNISKETIGMHEELLNQSFWEAHGTFVHEIAHNKDMSHDVEFRQMLQALSSQIEKKLTSIAQKAVSEQALTPEEEAIVGIAEQWDRLRLVA